jgi:hypothetical protein
MIERMIGCVLSGVIYLAKVIDVLELITALQDFQII